MFEIDNFGRGPLGERYIRILQIPCFSAPTFPSPPPPGMVSDTSLDIEQGASNVSFHNTDNLTS
jgi:hypothetical protein